MMKRAVTAALFVVVLAGCSGDDSGSVSTTDDPAFPPVGTAPATPAPPTSSGAPESTGARTATSTTSTTSTTTSTSTTTLPPAPPTTAAPPSTNAPVPFSPEDIAAAEEADRQRAIAVERDWREATRRTTEALFDPTDLEALARALEYTTDAWTAITSQFVAGYRDRGEHLLAQPLRDPTLTVESAPVAVPFTSDEVTIITCEIDPWVRVSSDGTVVSDTVSAYRDEVTLRLENGIWKTVSEVTIQNWIGGDACLA